MKTQDLTKIGFMIAIMIVLGLFPAIPIGILPVPIILQNMAFMLSGALLGKKNGAIATSLFLLLVAIGLPFLSGGRGGIAVFVGTTAGYLWSYPFASFLIGLVSEKWNSKNPVLWKELIVIIIFGVLFIDFCGAVGLTIVGKMSLSKSLLGSLLFLPGDLLKAGVTAVISLAMVKVIPALRYKAVQ